MELKDAGLIALGLIGASIAYLQWVTAHQKMVVDLFDRRRRAFEALEQALRPAWREGEVDANAFWAFVEAKQGCRFLFGQDVFDYLDSLHKDFAWLRSFTNDMIDQSPERAKLLDEKYVRLGRIVEFYDKGAPLFVDYLRLDMKVKSFWPFPAKSPIKDEQAVGGEKQEAPKRVRTRKNPRYTKYIANDGDFEEGS